MRRGTLLLLLAFVVTLSFGCADTYVKSHFENIPTSETGTVFRDIQCDQGDNASGGGIRIPFGGTYVTSEPNPATTNQEPTGWLGGWADVAGKTVSVYVVCIE